MRSRIILGCAFIALATACTTSTNATSDGGTSDTSDAASTTDAGAGADTSTTTTADAGADTSTTTTTDAGTGDAATGTDGGSTVDLTTVCNGADQYEPNNTQGTAKALPLNAKGVADIGAGVTQADGDFYSFVTPKADPVTVTVAYTAPVGDSTQLTLKAVNQAVAEQGRDTTTRTGTSQTLLVNFEATAGGTFAAEVNSDNATCMAYELKIDAQVCTDAFEDNDDAAHPATLPTGVQNATISALDVDWYKLTAPATAGSCVVSYTVPAANTQQVAVILMNSASSEIMRDTTQRTGTTGTLTVNWTVADAPALVKVVANDDFCTSYTINCH